MSDDMNTSDAYQAAAGTTAIYPGRKTIAGLLYATLGLAGEAGEIANKVKKILRDNRLPLDCSVENLPVEIQDQLIKEIGDVQWYVAEFCTNMGVLLSMVQFANLDRLHSRAKRGTLSGSGDDR